MRILKNSGSFVIITPVEELRRQLLAIEIAGRTCYQSEKGEITPETAATFVKKRLRSGHESVIEHTSMTIKFLGCSRGFTHELVRHRLASFSQESTRYVDESDTAYIVPPHHNENCPIRLDDGRRLSLSQMLLEAERYYRALRKAGWAPEDARQILPTAVEAEIVITANFREWRHIFEMRTQKAAHWEIRAIMCKLLAKVQELVPAVFDDFEFKGEDKNGIPYFVKRV